MGLLICPCLAKAQGQFVLSGEIRERGFYSHGYERLLEKSEYGVFWVAQRTRLGFDYTHKNLEFFVQLEDGRVWGESGPWHSIGFGIAQAWFQVDFAENFRLKVGRMPLVYENGRYMAYSTWDECGNGHDALVLRYLSKDERTRVDLAGSVSNTSESSALNPYEMNKFYKYLALGYFSRSFTPDFRWSLLSVTDFQQLMYTDQNNKLRYRYEPRSALGSYFDLFSDRKVSALVYGYAQIGEDLLAGMASAILTFKIHPVFELKTAYEFVSGNSVRPSDLQPPKFSDHAFNRFMGSSHSFMGIMDLFKCDGKEDGLSNAGLHQPYLTFTYRPKQGHRLSLDARYFWTVYKPYPYDFPSDRNLGLEVALTYKYDITSELHMNFGYAVHSRTRTLEMLSGIEPGNAKLPHFGFVSITYRPEIFNTAHWRRKDQ